MAATHFDLDSLLNSRRQAATETLRRAEDSYPALLVEQIFAESVTHPWYDKAREFLQNHQNSIALRGEIPDEKVSFIFYPKENTGFWFRCPGQLEAIGLLSHTSCAQLLALATEKGLV